MEICSKPLQKNLQTSCLFNHYQRLLIEIAFQKYLFWMPSVLVRSVQEESQFTHNVLFVCLKWILPQVWQSYCSYQSYDTQCASNYLNLKILLLKRKMHQLMSYQNYLYNLCFLIFLHILNVSWLKRSKLSFFKILVYYLFHADFKLNFGLQ